MAVDAVIQKVSVEVNGYRLSSGKLAADRVMRILKERVFPRLEALLEAEYGGTTDWVQLDRLELDLGNFTEASLAHQLPEVLSEKLPVQLEQAFQEAQPQVERPAGSPPPPDRLVALFAFFLEKGVFPWWADTVAPVKAELEAQLMTAMAQPGAAVRFQSVWDRMLRSPVARARLAQQFSSALVIKGLELTQPMLSTHLPLIHQVIELFAPGNYLGSPSAVSTVLDRLMLALSSHPEAPQHWTTQWLTESIHIAFPQRGPVRAAVAKLIEQVGAAAGKLTSTPFLETLRVEWTQLSQLTPPAPSSAQTSSLKLQAPSALPDLSETSIDPEKLPQVFLPHLSPEEKETAVQTLFDRPTPEFPSAPQSTAIPEEIYLSHAGLVLLGPFLPHFLTTLGLTNGTDWTPKTAQIQAIYVLHYLVTGEVTASEEVLFLPKLLCGWPLDMPLPAFELTDTVFLDTEIQTLYSVLQQQWSPIQHAPFEGLQRDFLQRPGKLHRTPEGAWKLLVEPNAADLVLQFISYNFHVLRFAWMKEMVFVEWGSN